MCMVTDNMNLVPYILKRYFNYKPNTGQWEDLMQIGYVGLIKAVKKFNPDLGYQFATYATTAIYGEIARYFRDCNIIRYTRSHKADMTTVRRLNGNSVEEIVDKTGFTVEKVKQLLNDINIQSLDSLIDEKRELKDVVTNVESFEECLIDKLDLDEQLGELTEFEKEVMTLTYIDGYNQPEIAKKLNTNQVMISRTISRSIKKLQGEASRPRKDAKKIYQYSADGVLIREFESLNVASNTTGIGRGSISQCANLKRSKAGGYIWRYESGSREAI